MSRHYVDTSALVKLLVAEPESDAMTELASRSAFAVSVVGVVELARAVRRSEIPGCGPALAALVGSIDQVALTPAVVEAARTVEPPAVRTLDAIHVASALVLGGGVEGLVTYDTRMATAARAVGLQVIAPGRD